MDYHEAVVEERPPVSIATFVAVDGPDIPLREVFLETPVETAQMSRAASRGDDEEVREAAHFRDIDRQRLFPVVVREYL